jgi:hypothetical protein
MSKWKSMSMPAELRRRWLLPVALLLSGLLNAGATGGAPFPPAPPPAGYRVVVHHSNPGAGVDRRFLSQAFLRKTASWPHGEAIRPVDLPADSAVRRRFSEEVHGRSVAAVKSYWQQVIFSGRGLPPPELESDQAVIRFVSRYPGAVGYVSGDADLRSVKALSVK